MWVQSHFFAIFCSPSKANADTNGTACSAVNNNETCQTMIFDIEGPSSNINVYNLNTVGSTSLVNRDGKSLANYADNVNVFPDTIALFKTD